MLLFLNEEWDKEWGGVLYLGEHKQIEVMPLLGRMVIFECGDASWHGHPEPVTGEHWRKSLAVYWYAPPRAAVRAAQHDLAGRLVRRFDCFMFRDELDMLEMRLHELDGKVDCHVLVECATDPSRDRQAAGLRGEPGTVRAVAGPDHPRRRRA